MPKRGKSKESVDRAAEYIDSPLMRRRLRFKGRLSVEIDGNFGLYRTEMRTGKKFDGSCTCPSEEWPCKHLRALKATWEKNPGSFLDLQALLNDLSTKSSDELAELIGQMAMLAPETLSLCGVEGFDDEDNEEQFYDDEDFDK